MPLGGLVGDNIYLVPERVKRLAARLHKWVALRRTPAKVRVGLGRGGPHQVLSSAHVWRSSCERSGTSCLLTQALSLPPFPPPLVAQDRKLAILMYGFPPGVGATGTAALLNVPKSLESLLRSLRQVGKAAPGSSVGPSMGSSVGSSAGTSAGSSVGTSAGLSMAAMTVPRCSLRLGPVQQSPRCASHPPCPLHHLEQEGYDLGEMSEDLEGAGEAIVTALKMQEEQRSISGGLRAGVCDGSVPRTAGVAPVLHRRRETQFYQWCRLPPLRAAEGAAGILKRGAGVAEPYGAKAAAVDVEPKQLKEMLTYPAEWGPTEWGECRAGKGGVGNRPGAGTAAAPGRDGAVFVQHVSRRLDSTSQLCFVPTLRRPHPLPARKRHPCAQAGGTVGGAGQMPGAQVRGGGVVVRQALGQHREEAAGRCIGHCPHSLACPSRLSPRSFQTSAQLPTSLQHVCPWRQRGQRHPAWQRVDWRAGGEQRTSRPWWRRPRQREILPCHPSPLARLSSPNRLQPLLGVEGDPMRLLFERDLTPHPQVSVRQGGCCVCGGGWMSPASCPVAGIQTPAALPLSRLPTSAPPSAMHHTPAVRRVLQVAASQVWVRRVGGPALWHARHRWGGGGAGR